MSDSVDTTDHRLMDIEDVMAYLPHRYPMLLIDRVLAFTPNESLVALKNVTINEPYFPGHYPHKPVMPGVLILEVMAQATGILALRSMDRKLDESSVYYFAGIDNARFRKPVVPGDQLVVTVELKRHVRGIWKVAGSATVDGAVVASADLMGALRENERKQ